MEDGAEMEMPRYVSHKTVHALELKGRPLEDMSMGKMILEFADKGYAPILVDWILFARYKPVAGDFYVVYADGYTSFSPRKAFLDGYTKQN